MNSKSEIIRYLHNYYIKNNRSPIIKETHPFTFNTIKKLFTTWNNALILSNIPLNRNKQLTLKCKLCKKEFNKDYKEMKKVINSFCSCKCAAIYNNTGRKMSDETKEKIRKKLEIIRFTKCKICKLSFRYYKRKNLTCSSRCLFLLRKRNNLKKKD